MKKNLLKFIIIFILTSIIFLPYLSSYFVTDTYNIIDLGYEQYTKNYWLKDGRLITASIGMLLSYINANIEIVVIISVILTILINTLSVMYLASKVKKSMSILALVFSYYTIFNFMYLDMLKFIEAPIMALSVFLCIMSANYLVNITKRKQCIVPLILLVISSLCYQSTIIIFVVFVTFFAYLKDEKVLKNIIIAIAFSGIVLSIDLLLVSNISALIGIEQTRGGSITKIFSNIKYLSIVMYATLIETCYVFPKYAFIVLLFITIVAIAVYSIHKKNYSIIKTILIITTIAMLAAFVFPVITLDSYDAGRMKLSIGILIGIIYLLLYIKTDIFTKNTIFTKILLSIFVIYAVTTTISYSIIINEQKNVNKYEKEQVKEIEQYISQYEEENNTQIKYIQKVRKKNHELAMYPNTKFRTINALKAECSAVGVINYYTNRDLKPTYQIKNVELYLTQKDYVCVGEVLLVAIRIF